MSLAVPRNTVEASSKGESRQPTICQKGLNRARLALRRFPGGLSRKSGLILALICGLGILPSSARELDTSGMLAELTAHLANAKHDLSTLNTKEISLKRKDSVIASELTAFRPKAQALQNRATASDQERDRLNGEVDRWNRECARAHSDERTYQRCLNRQQDLRAWQTAYTKRRNAIIDDTIALSRDLASKQLQQKDTRSKLADVPAERLKIEARIRRVDKDIQDLTSIDEAFLRDPKQRDRIGKECLGKKTVEEVVECMKAIYDGARVSGGGGASTGQGPAGTAPLQCKQGEICCKHVIGVSGDEVCVQCCTTPDK